VPASCGRDGEMKKNFVNLVIVTLSLAVAVLALEIVLRFLPVAWAPAVQPPTPDDPIQRYRANTPFTWSLGWNFEVVTHKRTNAQGFVADYDYDASAKTPLVAVAGDSFVEALLVPFAESLTGRLQAMLGNRGRAYAFAQSGSPLSQYVAYARHACARYKPERLVVTIVGNDFDESVYPHRLRDGIYHLYPRPDGRFDYELTPPHAVRLPERVARNSALALYLVRNVGVGSLVREFGVAPANAAGGPPKYVGNTLAAADPARITEGEQVIAWFLDALPREACLQPRDIVLVVDAIRPQIYEEAALGAARDSYFGRMRAALMEQARARQFIIVDTEPHFRAAYAKDGQTFEYRNDGHWNPHGHAVVAAAVREALAAWPPFAAAPMTQRR
jgi:SGNH hydrolase-like domain, acetyltransferase AlgX